MNYTWDENKRLKTLEERGLDFRNAAAVLGKRNITIEDDRRDYGEPRYQTMGWLELQLVMIVWTPRGEGRRIISMRMCDAQERRYFRATVD